MNPKSLKNLRPFKKGPNSKRPKGGPVCIERMAWTNLFLNRLAKRLKPADAADILATAYEQRRPWAITEVHERLMGRVTQPIGGDPSGTPIRVKLEKIITTIDPNGSGSSGD